MKMETAVTSFAEVETQLTAFAKLQAQAVQAEAQRGAVAESLRIANTRYREAYSSYLEELLAQRNLFAIEQSLLQLRAELLNTEVNVYRALGGGWEQDGGTARAARQSVRPAIASHVVGN